MLNNADLQENNGDKVIVHDCLQRSVTCLREQQKHCLDKGCLKQQGEDCPREFYEHILCNTINASHNVEDEKCAGGRRDQEQGLWHQKLRPPTCDIMRSQEINRFDYRSNPCWKSGSAMYGIEEKFMNSRTE